MQYTTDRDIEARLIDLLDAAQQEPVFIERGQQQVAVLLSVRGCDRLRGSATREFLDFCDTFADKAAAKGLTVVKMNDLLHNA